MKRVLLLLGACWGGVLSAAEPAWWSIAPTSIKSGAPANNAGPVNGGQLKNVAKKAALYLDTVLPPPGAGPRIHALVAGFSHSPENFAPISLGQLKFVAKPFYDRLQGLGFDTKQSLASHGAPGWPYPVPWNPGTVRSVNLSPRISANSSGRSVSIWRVFPWSTPTATD